VPIAYRSPVSVTWLCPDRLIFARLLASRGQDREALSVLEASSFAGYTSHEVELSLEIGRIAERLAEHARAVAPFAWVTRVWQHADPPAARYAEGAARAIARLERR